MPGIRAIQNAGQCEILRSVACPRHDVVCFGGIGARLLTVSQMVSGNHDQQARIVILGNDR